MSHKHLHIPSTSTPGHKYRFRDLDPALRCTVIRSVGAWVLQRPQDFLQDNFLRYLAWALSDAAPAVRLAAVTALEALYAQPENAVQLQELTSR